ncbi:hypothetical protein RZS08_22255, partial [Arthrospira platensis SPKY1]|nr:hypothetical protein [Arthrospira platensis SPKY1]
DNPAFPGCETSISYTFNVVSPTLLCPGDMLITLDGGECCWPAEYWARTINCTPEHQTINPELIPQVIEGFVGPFDPTGFPEFDPNISPDPDWSQPFTLNGPASTYGPSLIYLQDLPDFLYLEGYDDNPG